MSDAETIYIQGVRRAYPVAFYLWYALTQTNWNVVLLGLMVVIESYPSLKVNKIIFYLLQPIVHTHQKRVI